MDSKDVSLSVLSVVNCFGYHGWQYGFGERLRYGKANGTDTRMPQSALVNEADES